LPQDANGQALGVAKSVVEYSTGGNYSSAQLNGRPPSFITEKVIDRQAVGVYLLIEGTAQRVRFEVSSASSQTPQIAEWTPGMQRG